RGVESRLRRHARRPHHRVHHRRRRPATPLRGVHPPGDGRSRTARVAGPVTLLDEPVGLRREREDLVAYGRRLAPDGLAIGTAGNLSCRAGDVVAITPRGVGYDVMAPQHICLVTLDGGQIDAPLGPSSELPMHLAVYRRCDAAAVV